MTAPTAARRMTAARGVPDRRRLRPFYQAIRSGLAPDFTPTSAWCLTRRGEAGDEYIVAAENDVGGGSGAFSYLDGVLYATTFSLATYEQRIARRQTGIVTRHALSEGNRMRYALLVRLFGLELDRAWARQHHGKKFFRRLWGELRTLELFDAARCDDHGWRLTPRSMYWLVLKMSEFLVP